MEPYPEYTPRDEGNATPPPQPLRHEYRSVDGEHIAMIDQSQSFFTDAPTHFATVAELVKVVASYLPTLQHVVRMSTVNHCWRRALLWDSYEEDAAVLAHTRDENKLEGDMDMLNAGKETEVYDEAETSDPGAEWCSFVTVLWFCVLILCVIIMASPSLWNAPGLSNMVFFLSLASSSLHLLCTFSQMFVRNKVNQWLKEVGVQGVGPTMWSRGWKSVLLTLFLTGFMVMSLWGFDLLQIVRAGVAPANPGLPPSVEQGEVFGLSDGYPWRNTSVSLETSLIKIDTPRLWHLIEPAPRVIIPTMGKECLVRGKCRKQRYKKGKKTKFRTVCSCSFSQYHWMWSEKNLTMVQKTSGIDVQPGSCMPQQDAYPTRTVFMDVTQLSWRARELVYEVESAMPTGWNSSMPTTTGGSSSGNNFSYHSVSESTRVQIDDTPTHPFGVTEVNLVVVNHAREWYSRLEQFVAITQASSSGFFNRSFSAAFGVDSREDTSTINVGLTKYRSITLYDVNSASGGTVHPALVSQCINSNVTLNIVTKAILKALLTNAPYNQDPVYLEDRVFYWAPPVNTSLEESSNTTTTDAQNRDWKVGNASALLRYWISRVVVNDTESNAAKFAEVEAFAANSQGYSSRNAWSVAGDTEGELMNWVSMVESVKVSNSTPGVDTIDLTEKWRPLSLPLAPECGLPTILVPDPDQRKIWERAQGSYIYTGVKSLFVKGRRAVTQSSKTSTMKKKYLAAIQQYPRIPWMQNPEELPGWLLGEPNALAFAISTTIIWLSCFALFFYMWRVETKYVQSVVAVGECSKEFKAQADLWKQREISTRRAGDAFGGST